ncbi:MAG: adenylate/guanylate cyclase domain-containing protein [Bacteroidetes bacterium]|nr:adenylate/guanylate cyclase domain-containing protein [Bacteroidota bacterium]
MLLNILPEEVADELKKYGKTKAKSYSLVTVLFADIKNFTKLSEKMTPEQLIKELDIVFGAFDEIIQRHNIERIKIIGDCYMCAGGIPVANTTNPIDVVSAAREMCSFMNKINIDKKAAGHEFFNLRIGVHSGPIVAGIVGTKKFAYDIWGDTVNIAARLESSGEVGQINISETTYNLVKDKYPCTPRGKLEAKNKGLIDMYFVD